ncbi:type IV pili, partial [Francisella tularensis subsp. holarctica]|nr:type IV pili [Francisella tularensis subsp. holarctica]
AYFEGELTTEYVGGVVADIIKEIKLGRFVKLGFTSYNEIDVSKEQIICDKRALEIIEKEVIHFYIRDNFLKKRFLENYVNLA